MKSGYGTLLMFPYFVAMAFLPLALPGYVVVFGGEFPLGGVLIGFLIGSITAISMCILGYQLWSRSHTGRLITIGVAVAIIDLAWILIGRMVG